MISQELIPSPLYFIDFCIAHKVPLNPAENYYKHCVLAKWLDRHGKPIPWQNDIINYSPEIFAKFFPPTTQPKEVTMKKAKTISSTQPIKTTTISLAELPWDYREHLFNDGDIPDSPGSEHVRHENNGSVWIHIPNIDISKDPNEWEIRMRYDNDEAVIKGNSTHIDCGNLLFENEYLFRSMATALAGHDKESGPDKNLKTTAKIKFCEANENNIIFEIEEFGRKFTCKFDFVEHYNIIKSFFWFTKFLNNEPEAKQASKAVEVA